MDAGRLALRPPRCARQLSDELDALLYDWHNDRVLKSQRTDGPHWRHALRDAGTIAVFGAGTGRVASLLAEGRPGRLILAIDRSAARLGRILPKSGLRTAHADLRTFSTTIVFDAVLFPYSTLQMLDSGGDRAAALGAAARILRPGGTLGIDLSTSFEKHRSRPWQMTASGPCPELGTTVEEWERLFQAAQALTVIRRYRADGQGLGQVMERWTHHSSLKVRPLLEEIGFEDVKVSYGYRNGSASHRRLYRATRR